ncbi:TonB family protein [Kordiimonas gwangyangensis]|uniref:TonB family protein n=1 Tax=Kordiimonas gwangyangensis TaxID=288022 RepID=UPI00138AD670|nr:TonB family protein [Kordiimonas gwangyangensis]
MTSILRTGVLVAACTASLFTLSACGGSGSSVSGVRPAPTSGGSGEIRRVPAMSLNVHKMIQAAQEALSVKDLDRADAMLDNTLAYERINDYERAVAWQLKAMVAFERNDTSATIKAYEAILSYTESIPPALELNIIYGLAQLHYSAEDYSRALEYGEVWAARNQSIRSNQYVFLAQTHYVLENYKEAEAYIRQAIKAADAEGVEPKESWYNLLLSSEWEQRDLMGALATLQTMLPKWPNPKYCSMLAGVSAELSGDTEKALAFARGKSVTCTVTQTTMTPEKSTVVKVDGPEEPAPKAAESSASPMPFMRVQPKVPMRAIKEKVNGMVLLEVTILEDGTVAPDSIVVVESVPKGYYEEASIVAMRQMRYKPKMVDGVAQKMTGVRYRFSYNIEN